MKRHVEEEEEFAVLCGKLLHRYLHGHPSELLSDQTAVMRQTFPRDPDLQAMPFTQQQQRLPGLWNSQTPFCAKTCAFRGLARSGVTSGMVPRRSHGQQPCLSA